jgi:hypothetical protein
VRPIVASFISCHPVPCNQGGAEVARKLSDTIKLNLRFSEELRRKLERAAEKNNQSMNLEIVERLEHSFRKEEIRDVVREVIYEALDILEVLEKREIQ